MNAQDPSPALFYIIVSCGHKELARAAARSLRSVPLERRAGVLVRQFLTEHRADAHRRRPHGRLLAAVDLAPASHLEDEVEPS